MEDKVCLIVAKNECASTGRRFSTGGNIFDILLFVDFCHITSTIKIWLFNICQLLQRLFYKGHREIWTGKNHVVAERAIKP